MNLRILVHKELIDTEAELRHFIIKIPNDCKQIVAVDISFRETPPFSGEKYRNRGNLRIERRGKLLFEERVMIDSVKFEVEKTFAPDFSDLHAVSGGRRLPMMISIDGRLTILEGKFQVADKIDPFELILTFYYTRKS